jgi:cyclopropane-fatty-acyl-phospholipid synthase
VVGITLSTEQLRFAQERWKGLPLSFHLCDYRKLGELLDRPFDRIVSVGMYEHVGPKNGRTFFRAVRNLLRADGLFLLHTIGYRTTTRRTDPWIDTHVFRHGRLPSPQDLGGDLQSDFLIEDWHNFGPDYDRTLMAWWRRFEAAWPSLSGEIAASRGEAGAEEFHRFWRYYLLCCAGFFRSRQGQLWQLVLSRADQPQHEPRPPYRSIRPGACALRGEAVLA